MIEIHTSYFQDHNRADFIQRVKDDLKDVDFDTMVGTGFSGIFSIIKLAPAMGKHSLLLRKPTDDSHSETIGEGVLGDRWIFVDDFSCTGNTRNRVIRQMEELVRYQLELNSYRHIPITTNFNPIFVGCYYYRDREFETYERPTLLVEEVLPTPKEVAHGSYDPHPDPFPHHADFVGVLDLESVHVSGQAMVPNPLAKVHP